MNLNQPISRVLLSSVLVVGFASHAAAQGSRPSAPARLAAAAGQDGSITLTWADRSSNETGFRITRQPAFPDGDQIVAADQTTFTDRPGTGRFVYRVAAFNDSGLSGWTAAARIRSGEAVTSEPAQAPATSGGAGDGTVTPNPGGSINYGVPNAPSNLTTTPSLTQVFLSWNDNSDNEIFFEIQKQKQSGTSWVDQPGLQVWIDNTTLTDTAVSLGTYRYRVRAGQFAGYSAFTPWVTATITDPATPPAAPSGLTVTDAGSGRAMASWTDNANNETSYKIERNPAFPSGIITLNANTVSYLDPCGNGTFAYRVRTSNAAGTSAPTAWVSVTVTSGSTGPASGACCSTGGTCSVMTQAACLAGGGTYQGDNVTCAAANCSTTPPPPSSGWTNLTPPAGAQVFYAAANGADTNPGTQAAPFRTIGRGLQALRDGQADQLLLRSGDTFTVTDQINIDKASGSTQHYMVIGSYGAGARPKIRAAAQCFYGGQRNKTGFAIVGLDLEPSGPNQDSGILFFDGWKNILIEDCWIAKFGVNIVIQEIGTGRIDGVKIRRCVIVDSATTSGGHSQGIFLGCVDNWLIEGCVIDNNARANANMFCHNLYCHETSGRGVFKDNISSRACSHGGQQRPGGETTNNLFLQNPINYYSGGSGGNTFRYNVAIDSRDINSVDGRGIGFTLGGGNNTVVEYNVAAHQQTGTDAVTAFIFDGVGSSATVRGNVVFDWKAPGGQGWATAFAWEDGSGTALFENNQAYMPNNGVCVFHIERPISGMTYRNNKYWSTNPATGYNQFALPGQAGVDWNGWRNATGETGSTFANPGTFNVRPEAYMQSLGMSGGQVEFLTEARKMSRQNYRPQFTSDGMNDWVRTRFGMGTNP